MFDTYADALPVWVGLTVVSGVALAAVLAIPGTPLPDAMGAATAVDDVAAAGHASARTLPVEANAVRLCPRTLGLRNAAGAAHAGFTVPVTPADTPGLRRVLAGDPPGDVYPTTGAFVRAARRARRDAAGAGWRPITGPLAVRHVVLGGADVTLVG